MFSANYFRYHHCCVFPMSVLPCLSDMFDMDFFSPFSQQNHHSRFSRFVSPRYLPPRSHLRRFRILYMLISFTLLTPGGSNPRNPPLYSHPDTVLLLPSHTCRFFVFTFYIFLQLHSHSLSILHPRKLSRFFCAAWFPLASFSCGLGGGDFFNGHEMNAHHRLLRFRPHWPGGDPGSGPEPRPVSGPILFYFAFFTY